MAAPAFKTISATSAWQHLNTPQTLWASLYLIWALDLVLLIAAVSGARVHRDAMRVIGKDAAPSMIHAQHIKSALADMDANASNELLAEPARMMAAVKIYENRRIEAATALIAAAKNITFDEAEQKPIEALQVGMGSYERMVQRARDLRAISDSSYVRAYLEAARVMDDELLPRADELDRVNADVLNKTYRQQLVKSVVSIVFLLLLGAALTAALLGTQKFLEKRTHRVLNPLLVAATLLTLGFVIYAVNTLGTERHDLKVAREDAFTSIHALWRARATAYSANSDESRYLLDAAHAPEYEEDFQQKAAALASIPSGTSIENIAAAYRDGRRVGGFTGYLADELNNITFDGELELAVAELDRFNDYVNLEIGIRRLQQSGQHVEAVQFCLGTNPGQSAYAFDQFDQALGRTLDLNQRVFDSTVRQGFEALDNFEWKVTIISAAIAFLSFLGLNQRIREYR